MDIFEAILNFIWRFIVRPIAWIFRLIGKVISDILKGVYGKLVAWVSGIIFLAIVAYILNLSGML